MTDTPHDAVPALALQVDYVHDVAPQVLLDDPQVLALVGYGDAPLPGDPRCLRVGLRPAGTAAALEVWRCRGPVRHGLDGDIAWAGDGEVQFGAIEVAEADGDVAAAAEHAYARLSAFVAASATPHLLRVWNYLDAILEGEGDAERYRRFSVGRARGWRGLDTATLPAATCIGREDGVRVVQVYWLATREPGTPLENPRQVSAWRYPRQYGPQPPSFARAMLPPAGAWAPLLLSGTASVVGHRTLHAGELTAQLRETFDNLEALLQAAHARRPSLPAQWSTESRLKVYVRHAADLAQVAAALHHRFGDALPCLLLQGTVCRDDLLLEIEGSHDG